MKPFARLVPAALALALAAGPALAEGRIRIVEQFGISYLPLHVIRDQDLIAKAGRDLGVEIETEWARVSGGAAANDALLSGSVDVVAAGLGPLLTIWDRTRGSNGVRGVAALARINFALITSNPEVRTLSDFGEADKIAVPSVSVSVQARALQLAAAKAFGREEYARLDALTVSLPHPDATQALLSGSGAITAHFSNTPFQQQALKDPSIHKVTDWYEILGGPATSVTLYATEAFRADNPKTFRAFLAALREANEYILRDPEGAAETYLRVNGSKEDPAFILELLKDPELSFDPAPSNTEEFAAFLHEIGAIKTKPESWRDYFFPEIHDANGS